MIHHVRSSGLSALAAGALFALNVGSLQAQQNSLFGASSPLAGNNGFQSGSNVVGQSSGGGVALPSTSLPSNTLPGATGANNALGGQAGANGQRQTGFVGQQNSQFVGNAQARQGQTGVNNQLNNRQGQRNRGGQRGNQNQNNQMGGNNTNQQMRTVRPQLHVNIEYPKPSAMVMTTSLASRFKELSSRVDFKGVSVETEGNTVILRGSVDSEHTRRLAASFARLEPGVRKVKNELTVDEAPDPEVQ